jgi:diacylglycerol kinase (ATP)
VTLTYSPGEEQCRQLAGDAMARGDVVVAVGGDGMVASLAGTVVRAAGTLGIVPAGRGNDFARHLGLPQDPAPLARLLVDAPVRNVDVIAAAGQIVVGSVYAGIDSASSELVDRAHRLPRSLQYPYASVRAMATHKPTTYTVTVDGVLHSEHAHTVIVANSGYYGSGMHIAPAAALDDGILDIVIIKGVSRLRLLKAFRKVYDGSHVELDEVAVLTGRQVAIDAVGPVIAYGDGERIAALPITARVLPGALNVLA